MISRIKAAGLGDGYSGHSSRVGMARDLVRAGTELTALMNAGRWKSHEMPAHYTRAEEAGRRSGGAVLWRRVKLQEHCFSFAALP